MRIHVGCELRFEFPQTTPMIATLNVHFSRVSELERPDYLITNPSVPVEGSYRACQHPPRDAPVLSVIRATRSGLPSRQSLMSRYGHPFVRAERWSGCCGWASAAGSHRKSRNPRGSSSKPPSSAKTNPCRMGAKNKTGRKLLPSLTRRPLVERCNRRRPESSSHAGR